MLTLTYRKVGQWKPGHISTFCHDLVKEFDRQYVWVAELQKRGAMHYHLLTSLPDGAEWSKKHFDIMWFQGYTWVTPEVKKPFYLMKYLQKEYQKNGKQFPKGARIVGYSRPSHYISDRENNTRIASRFPGWLSGGLDEEGRAQLGGTIVRSRGGYRVGGKLAISPYSVNELPSPDEVMLVMSLANFGRLVYNHGGWELPQS